MKIIKRIGEVLLIIIISLVVFLNLYNFINLKVLKKDLSVINGYSLLEVVSGSMEPTIKVGDLIVIDTKSKNYKKNDIVTFYDVTGSFVTHRIVQVNKDTVITKGDANNSNDEAISKKNIVGKYTYKIPFLGMLLKSLKSPIALIFILIVGILMCYLLSLDEKENLKKKNNKKKKGR